MVTMSAPRSNTRRTRATMAGSAFTDNFKLPKTESFDAIRLLQRNAPKASGETDQIVISVKQGHVTDPARALHETRRVSGALLVSAFEAGWTHPAKAAVNDALAPFGYRPPAWYMVLKADGEPAVNDPANLAALATAAGYRDVSVRTVPVATGLDTPEQLARWRLGMAHIAPFVRRLSPADQADARRAVESTLAAAPPLVIPMIVLGAR